MDGSIPFKVVQALRTRTRRLQFLWLGASAVAGAVVSLVGTAKFTASLGLGIAFAVGLELRTWHLLRVGRLARGRLVVHPVSGLKRGHFLERVLSTYRTEVVYGDGC